MKNARSAAGWLIATVSVVAGVGLTYLLRQKGLIGVGPKVSGALPLQQLAGGESQPLARMAVAWLCAGGVAGYGLAKLARSGMVARTLGLGLLAAALLILAGAAADAIAISDSLTPHLGPQLSRTATWVAVALFVGGSLVVTLSLGRGEARAALRRRLPRPSSVSARLRTPVAYEPRK